MESRQNLNSFKEMIKNFDPAIAKRALVIRSFILKILPGCFEVVWVGQKVAGYGIGPKKKTEHFANICVYKNKVNLGFTHGGELPDPQGLLAGTGKLYRHVSIADEKYLKNPALKTLIKQAIKNITMANESKLKV